MRKPIHIYHVYEGFPLNFIDIMTHEVILFMLHVKMLNQDHLKRLRIFTTTGV